MNFTKALSQIAEIHEQLAKGEVYRGLRSLPVAVSGVCGFLGAYLQAWFLPAPAPLEVAAFWALVAALSGAIAGCQIAYNYIFRDDPFSRRRTRRLVGQFAPSLVAGAAVTSAALVGATALIEFLPGLWALVFGLGIFASRPYLPRATGWVALFYLGTGCVLLGARPETAVHFAWAVGLTFGAGQIAAALVLYWNLERIDHAS